jgi:hypothetical protein
MAEGTSFRVELTSGDRSFHFERIGTMFDSYGGTLPSTEAIEAFENCLATLRLGNTPVLCDGISTKEASL